MAKLTKTPNGWKCNVRINGERVRQILHRDRAQANRILQEMVYTGRAKRQGRIAHGMSWTYFQTEYLRKSKVNDSPKTYNHNRRAFNLIDKVIHVDKLEHMTPELLDEAQTRLKEKGFGSQAISRGVRAILTAMRRAEDFKYVSTQNWRLVKVEIKKGRLDFYELQQFWELVGKLKGVWQIAAWIMGRAGLRTGEALFLEWKDVQFENNRILFQSKPEYGWRIKGDKKLEKVRAVPLSPDLRAFLWPIRKGSGFVLDAPCARRVDSFGKDFTKALNVTGVPTYRKQKAIPYILRHTFASHLAQAGASDRFIAELLGDESIEMVKIYSHLRPVDLQKGINSLKNTVAALWPPSGSVGSAGVLLSPLNADLQKSGLSSEIHETT